MKQTSCDPLFVFAGGGTGGHIFPGLAVAESLMDALPQSRILFLSTGRPVEDRIFAGADFETLLTPAIRMRDMIRHPMRFVAAFVKATSIAKRIIREQQPAAIIGLGGVASVPLIRVAKKTPVVLLEQNVLPGRTTRWLAKRHAVMLSFNRTRAWLPNSDQHIVTGNPVQKSIQALVQSASDGRSTKSRQTFQVASKFRTVLTSAAIRFPALTSFESWVDIQHFVQVNTSQAKLRDRRIVSQSF